MRILFVFFFCFSEEAPENARDLLNSSSMVLLSAVDHYKIKGTKRVVGILLGSDKGEVYITESFTCIFEEDAEGWFRDTSYIRSMFDLFYKHNLKIMVWYHTGPKVYESDLEITNR